VSDGFHSVGHVLKPQEDGDIYIRAVHSTSIIIKKKSSMVCRMDRYCVGTCMCILLPFVLAIAILSSGVGVVFSIISYCSFHKHHRLTTCTIVHQITCELNGDCYYALEYNNTLLVDKLEIPINDVIGMTVLCYLVVDTGVYHGVEVYNTMNNDKAMTIVVMSLLFSFWDIVALVMISLGLRWLIIRHIRSRRISFFVDIDSEASDDGGDGSRDDALVNPNR
jgi:hypothetical protein